jgi:hypothetical protein
MKSVGEVQAIGRNFEEAFQKALRMLDLGYKGFEPGLQPANDFDLKNPTDVRPLVLVHAKKLGYTDSQVVSCVSSRSHADLFLADRQGHLSQRAWSSLLAQVLRPCSVHQADRHGFVLLVCCALRADRCTVAAEYPAQTNYLYLSYNGCADDVPATKDSVMVLGSGVYRIGSRFGLRGTCAHLLDCSPVSSSTTELWAACASAAVWDTRPSW